MTTLFKEAEKCLLCGQSHEYVRVGSTNEFGSPDLDTRPPEMRRSTMPYWIRRCPSCGYCAPEVSEGPGEVERVVESREYRKQLGDRMYPELANSFLCWAMIQEEVGDYARAGWAALHAAWACDDEGTPEASRLCRLRAIELFRQARSKGDTFIEGQGAEQVIMADLLRRSGQFEQVGAMYQEGLPPNDPIGGLQAKPGKIVRDVLDFQKALALLKDDRRHRIEEAVKQTPDRFNRGQAPAGERAIRRPKA